MRKCTVRISKEVLEYRRNEKLVKEGKTKFNIYIASLLSSNENLANLILKLDELDGQELKFHQFVTHNNVATAILEDSDGKVHLLRADYIRFSDIC